MSNAERIAAAVILFCGGIALGMFYEHQRFFKEIQGLSKKHADVPPPPQAPGPQPDAAA